MKNQAKRIVYRILEIASISILLAPVIAFGAVTLPTVNIHTLKLPNGFKALMVNRGQAPVVTVEMWYHVGSRDEIPGKTGYAHLLEHLMFDGTKTLGRNFSDYIVRVGGIDNAYTTSDATVFWETMPSSNLPVALWLEADRMRNLAINQQNLNNEREVVEEERRRRYDNRPYGTLIPAMYDHAFTVSPYRHLPIGYKRDVDHATANGIKKFYNTYYVPNNATVVIVGKFSIEAAEKAVQKYFSPIPKAKSSVSPTIPAEPPQTSERIVRMSRDVALPAFIEAYHIPADGTPDSYPLRLASRILSAGDSGLIYHQLVYEKQLALEAQSSAEFSENPNLFFIFAVMNAGRTISEGESAVESILQGLKEAPLPASELQKAKNQVLFDLAQSRASSKELAGQLGYDSAVLNDPDLVNTEAERFLSVSAKQVQSVVRKYFVRQNMTLLEVRSSWSEQAPSNLPVEVH